MAYDITPQESPEVDSKGRTAQPPHRPGRVTVMGSCRCE